MNEVRRYTLREPSRFDKKLDFSTYHDLVMAVARSLGIDLSSSETVQPILLMELDEELPPYDEEADADEETGLMPYIDKRATPVYYDPRTQTWVRDETQQKRNICNPYIGCRYYEGERVLFRYLQQAGKYVPVPMNFDEFYGRNPDEVPNGLVDARVDRYELVRGSWYLNQMADKSYEEFVLAPPTFGNALAAGSVVHVTWDRQAQTYRIDEREC